MGIIKRIGICIGVFNIFCIVGAVIKIVYINTELFGSMGLGEALALGYTVVILAGCFAFLTIVPLIYWIITGEPLFSDDRS
jgi:hypothetical protein